MNISLRELVVIGIVVTVLASTFPVAIFLTNDDDGGGGFGYDIPVDHTTIPLVLYAFVFFGVPYWIMGTARIPEFLSNILDPGPPRAYPDSMTPEISLLFLISVLLCWALPLAMFAFTRGIHSGKRILYILGMFFGPVLVYLSLVGNQPYN